MAIQTLLARGAHGADYFQNQMFPDKVATTGHFVAVAEDAGVPFVPWTCRMPRSYQNGENITMLIDAISVNTNSGSFVWQVEIERLAPNGNPLNSDNFASPQSATQAVSSTLSAITRTTIVFTQAQFAGVEANDDFRVRLTRNTASGGDTMIGNLLFLNWTIQSDVDD